MNMNQSESEFRTGVNLIAVAAILITIWAVGLMYLNSKLEGCVGTDVPRYCVD